MKKQWLSWMSLICLIGCLDESDAPMGKYIDDPGVDAATVADLGIADDIGKSDVNNSGDVDSSYNTHDAGETVDVVISFNCNDGSIEVRENTCCPLSRPKLCGNICVKEDCDCLSEYEICIPSGYKHCGQGITCREDWECLEENGETVCLPFNVKSCGNGNWCQLNEECVEINREASCCPLEATQICNDQCCFNGYNCLNTGNDELCLPQETEYCNAELSCPEGFKCTPDNTDCILKSQEYCDELGLACEPGFHCTEHGCCPDQQSECGLACCAFGDSCDQGVCVPFGADHCGNGLICNPGDYCAGNQSFPCVSVGSEICGNQVCEPGKFCVNNHCCEIDAEITCGNNCCPRGYNCVQTVDGLTCIPQSSEVCGDNQTICQAGFDCASSEVADRNSCMRVGWQDCGSGEHCNLNQACVGDENDTRCCDRDKMTYCVGDCCFSGWQCIIDEQKGRHLCIMPGATYCWGNDNLDWCPAAQRCGRIKCIPIGADECDNGDYCRAGYKCTNSPNPDDLACCPFGAEIPCGERCCANGFKCVVLNGEKTCVLGSWDVCRDTLFNETICPNINLCMDDGYCLPERFRDEEHNYCGCGKACPANQACQALCSDNCCEPIFDFDPSCIWQCLPLQAQRQYMPSIFEGRFLQVDQDLKMTFSLWFNNNRREIPDDIENCLNQCLPEDWQCTFVRSDEMNRNNYECYFRVPKSQGCLMGCMLPGQICYETPTDNSRRAYLTARESNIFPWEVPSAFGGWAELIDDVEFGLIGADVNFHPAGLSENFVDGIYRSGNVSENWITAEPGQEALEVRAVWIIDNMEGIEFPHGPYGQLYVLVFDKNHFRNLDRIRLNRITKNNSLYGNSNHFLKGALKGNCSWEICARVLAWEVYCKCSFGGSDSNVNEEWVSNMFMRYSPGAFLHVWQDNEETIRIALMESDGGLKRYVGTFIRQDDYCGFDLVDREATKKPEGIWVPLYKYEMDMNTVFVTNEYYRTNRIAAFLLLRTVKVL